MFGSSIGSKYEARWDRSRLGENGRQNGNVVMSIRHKIAKDSKRGKLTFVLENVVYFCATVLIAATLAHGLVRFG